MIGGRKLQFCLWRNNRYYQQRFLIDKDNSVTFPVDSLVS